MRPNRWLKAIFSVTFVVAFVVIVNVVVVSVFQLHIRSLTSLESYVNSVNYVRETIYASRGNIYDANGMTVATDVSTYSIICYMSESRTYADGSPGYVVDIEYTANVLANILGADQETIYEILESAQGLYQTEIGTAGRQIDEATKLAIEEYELPGVEFVSSSKRYYPLGDYFSPYLVGFAQDENGTLVGRMGVELYLNDELSGVNGYRVYQADENGYILEGMTEEVVDAKDGYDVYLTIDNVIQEALQEALAETIEDRDASQAWGIVVEISTGKILAWGQVPTFDSNELDIEEYNNYNSQYLFEPGSVFKTFAYAAAIEEGVYDGTAEVDSSDFCYVASGTDPVRTYDDDNLGCITNSENKTYGYVEYDYGLIMSLNTVTSSIVTDLIDPETYLEYLYEFGFFEEVDTDGISESVGWINFSQPVEKLTATYGSGLMVTALQLVQAYSAIFGNGEMVKPYYIDKIVDSSSGDVIYEGQREVVSQPISEETAEQLQELLRRVVTDEQGTARYYEVESVGVLAKTGTQQVADESGTYTEEGTVISSVILAFPADEPQYMIYYAYVSDYDRNNHYYTDPVTNLIERIALLYGLTSSDEDDDTSSASTATTYEMPDLVGHTLSYATSKLADSDQVVILGDGDYVISQYPSAGTTIYNNQKIFILTSTDSFSMPDLTGWTRKEVTELWAITGVAFTLDGYGIVTEQSIEAGTTVTKSDIVAVTFADLPDPDDDS